MNYALDEGLRVVLEEGLDNRVERHRRNAHAFYAAWEAMGLRLLADPAHRLPALTTAGVPDGVDDAAARAKLLNERSLEIGGGLGAFRGKAWRIGLMGASSTPENVMLVVGALGDAMAAQGKPVQ